MFSFVSDSRGFPVVYVEGPDVCASILDRWLCEYDYRINGFLTRKSHMVELNNKIQ